MIDKVKLISAAEQIALEAGSILVENFNKPLDINYKSRFDMVTEADIKSEEHIINFLNEVTPEIPVLSEEDTDKNFPSIKQIKAEYQWVVDPLDGTTNYTHGFAHFCVSIALIHMKKPIIGVIYDPIKKELFKALKGSGAFVNEQRIMVSKNSTLEDSIIATGFPYKVRELKQNNLAEFCAFRLNTQGVRRIGAAALDLAYVSCGRLDGFWERWLKPWDSAAGVVILEESGGVVTHFDGSDYSIFSNNILASNGLIHHEMTKILSIEWPDISNQIMQQI